MPTPLPYHFLIRDLLREMDPHVWKWFGQQRIEPAAIESLKFDLLKSTYRLTRDSHPRVYLAVDYATQALGLDLPVTIYQSSTDSQPNAALAFAPDEIHIVLHGKTETLLEDVELRALFGHEIGHHLLHQCDEGQHLQAWDVLRAISLDPNAPAAFLHSFRKLQLYNEIYCDRASMEVVDNFDSVVSMLVKLTMGASTVQSHEFLLQAHEVLDRKSDDLDVSSDGITHPEAYIRACALELFSKKSPLAEQEIVRWIEGRADLANLDLLQQRDVSRATRQLIRRVLDLPQLQSDLMLSHARLYFDDFSKQECADAESEQLAAILKSGGKTCTLRPYFCYVLLDFATADRDLEELPLANALRVAEELGIKETFIPLARKEMKLRKNQIDQWDQTKQKILDSAKSMNSSL